MHGVELQGLMMVCISNVCNAPIFLFKNPESFNLIGKRFAMPIPRKEFHDTGRVIFRRCGLDLHEPVWCCSWQNFLLKLWWYYLNSILDNNKYNIFCQFDIWKYYAWILLISFSRSSKFSKNTPNLRLWQVSTYSDILTMVNTRSCVSWRLRLSPTQKTKQKQVFCSF